MSDGDVTRVLGATATLPAPDRTMVLGNTAPPDAFRTQMGGVTTCPVCKTSTPLADPYCGECGFLVASIAGAEEVEAPAEEPAAALLVGSQDGRSFALRPGAHTVGRFGSDILIDDATVSRQHARITVDVGRVTVEDLGSTNGTKVGDQRIQPSQPTPAPIGTALRFGNWLCVLEPAPATAGAEAELTVAIPSDSAPAAAEAGSEAQAEHVAVLRKTEGPAPDIDVTEGVVSLGRRPGNAVVIPSDPYVSGRHAEIRTDNSGTYLTDLGSTNGTVVNGQRLAPDQPQLLLEGDSVQLGHTTYRFELVVGAVDQEEVPPASDFDLQTAAVHDGGEAQA